MDPTRPIDDPRSDPPTPRLLGWVALGGALGASARYGVDLAVPDDGDLPWSTLAVNVLGAFALGALLVALDRVDRGPRRHDPRVRAFAALGVLGAFTTYSAFSVETVDLLRDGSGGLAAAYVVATLVGGVVAIALGAAAARRLAGGRG